MEDAFKDAGVGLVKLDIQTKSELSPRLWAALPKLLRLLDQEKIDIIHSHSRVTQVLGCLAGLIKRRPHVVTCHGFFRPRIGRRVFPCWGNATIAISDAVTRHLITEFKVEPDRVENILTGIELDNFRETPYDRRLKRRREFGIESEMLIGMIARLSEVKGQDIAVKAMTAVIKECPAVKLAFFGEGKTENDLRALVERSGLKGHVLFFPTVGRAPEMLAMVDIVIAPSRSEGLGISVMEAQACGLPVVATRVGGLVSLIENEITGLLVPPENPEEFAKALIRVIKDRSFTSMIGKGARLKAESEYGADKMTTHVVALYEKLLTGFNDSKTQVLRKFQSRET